MMNTFAISIPSDDLFKDDFCNDKRIALLQHTVLCNMRSIPGPKLKKRAKNLIFGKNYINYAYLINYA